MVEGIEQGDAVEIVLMTLPIVTLDRAQVDIVAMLALREPARARREFDAMALPAFHEVQE